MTEEAPFRVCEFCQCNTNAKLRACCEEGRADDLAVSNERMKGQLNRHKEKLRGVAAMAVGVAVGSDPPLFSSPEVVCAEAYWTRRREFERIAWAEGDGVHELEPVYFSQVTQGMLAYG